MQYLQVYVTYKQPSELNVQYFVNTLIENYLSKDLTIQTALWKYCNTPLITILPQLKMENLMNKFDSKLLEVLKYGGVAMFKELPNYLQVFPFTSLKSADVNTMNNTVSYIRKFNEALLELDEEHELRLQCYCEINLDFIKEYHRLRAELPPNTPDDKENKRRD
jgi:hypothetical protein